MALRGLLRRRESRTSIRDQIYAQEKEKALVGARREQAARKMAAIRAQARAEAYRETAPRRSLGSRIGGAASAGLKQADRHFNPPRARRPRVGRGKPKKIYVRPAGRPRPQVIYVQAAPPKKRRKKRAPKNNNPFGFF